MLFLQFTTILILLYLSLRIYRNRHFSAKFNQFEGPTLLELIKIIISTRGSPTECFRIGLEWLKRYDSCFTYSSLMDTYVCTSRREDVQMLFKLSQKGRVYEFFQSSMGAGLITSNGEKWKKSRAIMDSAFAATALSTNLLQVSNEQSLLSIDEIERKGLGVDFNLWSSIMRALTRTMLEITIGSAKANNFHLNEGFGSGNRKYWKNLVLYGWGFCIYDESSFLQATKVEHFLDTYKKKFQSQKIDE